MTNCVWSWLWIRSPLTQKPKISVVSSSSWHCFVSQDLSVNCKLSSSSKRMEESCFESIRFHVRKCNRENSVVPLKLQAWNNRNFESFYIFYNKNTCHPCRNRLRKGWRRNSCGWTAKLCFLEYCTQSTRCWTNRVDKRSRPCSCHRRWWYSTALSHLRQPWPEFRNGPKQCLLLSQSSRLMAVEHLFGCLNSF